MKHPDLRPLHERAKKQAATLEAFTIQYIPREQNREADAAANAALDNTSGVKPAFGADPPKVVAPPRTEPRALLSAPRKIRARFRDGVLVPAEPLGYGENEELEITIVRRG